MATIIKANINDLLDKAENPQKVAKQLIKDIEAEIKAVKERVANAIVNERKLAQKSDEIKKEAESWQKRAEIAVERGDDELAKQALRRKLQQEAISKGLEEQLGKQKEVVATLRASLDTLKLRLQEAKARKQLLIATYQRTKAQKAVQRALAKSTALAAIDAFEQLAEKVADEELEAEASAQLDADSLVERFKREEEEAKIEQELADLKAKKAPAAVVAPKIEEPPTIKEGQ